MSALRDYRAIWRAAVASRDPRAKWPIRLIALLLPLPLGFLIWTKTGSVFETLSFAVRIPLGVFLFAALTFFMPGAVRMNTPETARLVPRMRRRLIQLTVLVWAGSTAVAVLLAADTALPLALVALGVLTWLIGLGLSAAGYQVGALFQVAPVLLSTAGRDHLSTVNLDATSATIATLLLLALAARTLEWMFPNGGERHWKRRGAQARAMERTRPEGLLRQAPTTRWASKWYAAALRRSSQQRRPGALLVALFGPALHWTQRYVPLLAVLAAGAVIVAVSALFTGARQFDTKWLGLLSQALLFAQLFTYGQRTLRLADTRVEQALLRMAPAVPAAPARFNRQLSAALLRMALLDWVAIVAILLAVSAIAGAPAEALLLQAQVGCLTLPLLAANVRDHARNARQAVLLLVGGLTASTAFSFGVSWLVHYLIGTPVMPGAALASVMLALAVIAVRWRRALAAPHAFPVGRLA